LLLNKEAGELSVLDLQQMRSQQSQCLTKPTNTELSPSRTKLYRSTPVRVLLQLRDVPVLYAPSYTNGGLGMDGDKKIEPRRPVLARLAGWAVIIGLCLLFWLGVYSFLGNWRAAY
jgi:hypothetical protein